MDWNDRHTICGIDELPRLCDSGPTHAVSILDPQCPSPPSLSRFDAPDRLVLRFHDILEPRGRMVPPKRGHVEMMLWFARKLPRRRRHLLVHCHAGISRSTAATAALMVHEYPDADEDQVMAHISRIRPQAWPNSRIVGYADEILGRKGRLVGALRRHYGRTLKSNPDLAYRLQMGGRGEEVAMAVI